MKFSPADGGLTVDINNMEEKEIIKLALDCRKEGKLLILTNVSNIERAVLERAAFAGKGLVLFDLR